MVPKAVLVGLPGAGKSTVGRRLAKILDVEFLDTDSAIEHHTGLSIAEIFTMGGESEFRRLEQQIICSALLHHNGILSLGGGAITNDIIRQSLKDHHVIFLDVDLTEGLARTSNTTTRPLLAGDNREEKFRTLMKERLPLYHSVATVQITTTNRTLVEVVEEAMGSLDHSARSHPSQGDALSSRTLLKQTAKTRKSPVMIPALRSELRQNKLRSFLFSVIDSVRLTAGCQRGRR